MFKITVFIRTTHSMRILVLFVLTCPKFVLINSFILNLLCVIWIFNTSMRDTEMDTVTMLVTMTMTMQPMWCSGVRTKTTYIQGPFAENLVHLFVRLA